jgi:hypothetical protein
MKTVIFFAALLIGTTVTAQIPKGLEVEKGKDSVEAYMMYTCGCFCSMESGVAIGEIDYYMTFHIDEHPDMSLKYMEKVFNKFLEVLSANGRSVDTPDMVQVTDYAEYPALKTIKTKLSIGFLPEERFDYIIGDYIVALIYSSTEYQLFIYKNPFAGQY